MTNELQDQVNQDLSRPVEHVAKQALRKLFQKASITCTTAFITTSADSYTFRKMHALFVDEIGRTPDVGAVGFFSGYWNVFACFFSGDEGQLKPMTFGPAKDNPLQKQTQILVLTRSWAMGIDTLYLPFSSRFVN